MTTTNRPTSDNKTNNVLTAKTLAGIKRQATNYLGGLLARDNSYMQRQLTLTDTSASAIADMTLDNTSCTVYDKTGVIVGDNTEAYIRYKTAAKAAADKAQAARNTAYVEALK